MRSDRISTIGNRTFDCQSIGPLLLQPEIGDVTIIAEGFGTSLGAT